MIIAIHPHGDGRLKVTLRDTGGSFVDTATCTPAELEHELTLMHFIAGCECAVVDLRDGPAEQPEGLR